jgi:hypothetical protein
VNTFLIARPVWSSLDSINNVFELASLKSLMFVAHISGTFNYSCYLFIWL